MRSSFPSEPERREFFQPRLSFINFPKNATSIRPYVTRLAYFPLSGKLWYCFTPQECFRVPPGPSNRTDPLHPDLFQLAQSGRDLVFQNSTHVISRGIFSSTTDLSRKLIR